MNKRDLIDYVSESLGTTKSSSEEIVNAVFLGVRHGVANDAAVSIAGFGTWTARQRASRVGRNPQTGDPIQIPASKTVGFKPARNWKEELN